MNELALFAGAGGGILGGHLLGWRTVCAVEYEPYAAAVLVQRQNDGFLPPFPIWDDVRTFDGRTWRGIVDVVSGGFPCQDISAAGKGVGITGERSGLWKEMARIVREVRPQYVFVENSPLLTSRGLDVVLGDLAEMGFDAEWGVYGAADAGAPHQRDRVWILGHSIRIGREARLENYSVNVWAESCSEGEYAIEVANSDINHEQRVLPGGVDQEIWCRSQQRQVGSLRVLGGRRSTQSGLGGMAHGVAARVDRSWPDEPGGVPRVATSVRNRVGRLKAIGNGQVPACAVLAWTELVRRAHA